MFSLKGYQKKLIINVNKINIFYLELRKIYTFKLETYQFLFLEYNIKHA